MKAPSAPTLRSSGERGRGPRPPGRGGLGRTGLLLAAAATVLALALPADGGAQEPAPADTAPRDSAGMAAIADSAIRARMDSARRAERQKRNAAVRSLRPGDRIRIQLGQHVLDGDLLNLVDGDLVLRTRGRLPPGLGREAGPDTAGRGDSAASADSAADVRRPAAGAADSVPGRMLPPADSLAAGGDSLPARAVRVPVDAMERLWVKVGSSDRGAFWGALAGGLGGAVAGYLADTASCDRQEGDCIYDGFDAAAVTGVGGALTGAALGVLVGKAFPRWRVWFP